jgi:hypothetical protein
MKTERANEVSVVTNEGEATSDSNVSKGKYEQMWTMEDAFGWNGYAEYLGTKRPPELKTRRCKSLQMLQYSKDGRVAQLGEHLLCKRVRALQRLHPLPSVFNVFNNFGESASRSK